jgi:hypothetical protein
MDEQDRLAYELEMAALQVTREDCLRRLCDQEPGITRRRSARWWRFDPRPARPKLPLAS